MDDKTHYDETDDITNYWERRHADWLANPNWPVFPYKQAWFEERFHHLLPPRVSDVDGGRTPIGTVLDYGCGCALYAAPLLERFRVYVGFDTSLSALKAARQYYHQYPKLLQRMFLNLYTGQPGEWENGLSPHYDLVISVTVLQHQPPPFRRAMISNIKSLLKPGGMYIGLEMQGPTQPYDMPQFPEGEWVEAWKPLTIRRDVPSDHPDWLDDNVWVAY